MFCWNCGKKISDISKFCPHCGSKVITPVTEISTENSAQQSISSNNSNNSVFISFPLRGLTIQFDSRIQTYTRLHKEFIGRYRQFISKRSFQLQKDIAGLKPQELDNCLDMFLQYSKEAFDWLVKTTHQELLADKIYHVSANQLSSMIQESATNFSDEYTIFSEKYLEIVANEQQLAEYKAQKRAGRSRWEGGGFGVAGAIKGAVTAGALNIGTDLVRSIGYAWTDSTDKERIVKEKRALLSSKNWLSVFYQRLLMDAECVFDIYSVILSENGKIELPEINRDKALVLFENAKSITQRGTQLQLIAEGIRTDPFIPFIYAQLLDYYGNFQVEVLKISEYFLDTIVLKELSTHCHNSYLKKLDAMPENTYEEISQKIEMINQRIGLIEEQKDKFIIISDYAERYGDKLNDLLNQLLVKQRTSDDGIICSSIEDLKQYYLERDKFKALSEQFTNAHSFKEKAELLNQMLISEFSSTVVLKNINQFQNSFREEAKKKIQEEKICPMCGSDLFPSAFYCGNCGFKLSF